MQKHPKILVVLDGPELHELGERARAVGIHLEVLGVALERLAVRLRYSSHTARSGLGLARVVRLFVWPRHANGMLSTTPLDPCACEMSAQGGNKRRTGRAAA